eukprot:scaffold12754_cov90-Isochrysis_galbana.AAC.1
MYVHQAHHKGERDETSDGEHEIVRGGDSEKRLQVVGHPRHDERVGEGEGELGRGEGAEVTVG